MIKRNDTLVHVVAERLMCDVAGFAGCGSASKIWRQSSNPLFCLLSGSPHKSGRIVGWHSTGGRQGVMIPAC